MILVFDTETDGLIIKGQLPPRIVQIAAILMNEVGTERASMSLIVKPEEGKLIPAPAAQIHGITTPIANACGVSLIVAMGMLSNLLKLATFHVAHNMEFDQAVVAHAFRHVNRPMPPLNRRCTKELTTPILNLPPTAKMIAAGFNQPKSPTLTECVKHFFNEEMIGAHGALADARYCGRVYLELMRLGHVV